MAHVIDLNIPPSQTTVRVRIIDSTAEIHSPLDMVSPAIPGHEELQCPSYSFLIEHPSGQKLLYDLGVRKNLEELPPVVQHYFKESCAKVTVEKEIDEILEEHGMKKETISAIIWSHWHYDHTGNPSKFPASTKIIVGPGFKSIFLPGYPLNPAAPLLESDWADRELEEVSFGGNDALKIGRFDAIDYFSDGSFYILDAPGHTVGHIAGLARVTSNPPSFILMGGDCCHHSSEMRPSQYLPLPSSIFPNPLNSDSVTACPGWHFEHLLRDGNRNRPFYDQKKPGMLLCDPDTAAKTIEKVQDADASGNVLVIIAHDAHLKGIVDFFPKELNAFIEADWNQRLRWAFLKDFRRALRAQR